MDINWIDFLLAISPIIWLFIALLVLKMDGYKATFGALILSSVLALLWWKMPSLDVATAILEGLLFTLWPILLVVVAAVFTYRVITHTGAMENIKQTISGVSTDKRILVLIIGWSFAGFMEGVAGFGTPIAIPAGMLWTMGFDPVLAAVATIMANITPTPFGAISILTLTLSEVTNLPVEMLSFVTIVQLAIPMLITPFIMILIVCKGQLKALKGVSLIAFISGITFFLPQFLVLKYVGPEMVAVIPPIISLLCTILAAKYLAPKEIPAEYDLADKMEKMEKGTELAPERNIFVAGLPFVITLILFILTSNLFPGINNWLSQFKSSIIVYTGANPATLNFDWINTPGVLIIFATIVGGLIQGATIKEMLGVFVDTIKQIYKTILTLLAVIATAKVISYSGMIGSISSVIVFVAGGFYPYIAPVLGMVGSFVTGSGTSAGILFGVMQVDAANALGVSAFSLAAANSVGASIGKVIAPQAIATAASTTGLSGRESDIFSEAIKWIGIYVVLALVISGITSKFLF